MDFNNYVCVHMYVYVWCVWPHTCMPQWICEGQRTTLRNLFSLSLYFPLGSGTEYSHQAGAASVFALGAILPSVFLILNHKSLFVFIFLSLFFKTEENLC